MVKGFFIFYACEGFRLIFYQLYTPLNTDSLDTRGATASLYKKNTLHMFNEYTPEVSCRFMYQKGLINSVYDYEYKNKNRNIFKNEAKKSGLKYNTMANKLMYIPNNDAQNYIFC